MKLVPKEKESDLVRAILTYLNFIRGIPSWRINSGKILIPQTKGGKRMYAGAPAGTSDILGILPVNHNGHKTGVFLAIEAKIKGNVPTQKQLAFLEQVRNSGGVAFVAYSLEDVESNINNALRGIPVVNQDGVGDSKTSGVVISISEQHIESQKLAQ